MCLILDVFQVSEIGSHDLSLVASDREVEAYINDQHQFLDISYSLASLANSSRADCSVFKDFGNSLRSSFSPSADSEWLHMLNDNGCGFPSNEENGPATAAIGFRPDFEHSSTDIFGASRKSADRFAVDESPARSLEIAGCIYGSENGFHMSIIDGNASYANTPPVCKPSQLWNEPGTMREKDDRVDFPRLQLAKLQKEASSAKKELSLAAEKVIWSADSSSALSCISRDASKRGLDFSESVEKSENLNLFKRARSSQDAADEFKSISSIEYGLLGHKALKRRLTNSEPSSIDKKHPGYRKDETSKSPSQLHKVPLHSSPESSQSNSVDCRSHDPDADICIIEEMSHPAWPNLPAAFVNTPTSHDTLNYTKVGLTRPRVVNSEQLIFRVALQVWIV